MAMNSIVEYLFCIVALNIKNINAGIFALEENLLLFGRIMYLQILVWHMVTYLWVIRVGNKEDT